MENRFNPTKNADVAYKPEIGQTVQWQGNFVFVDTVDGPCRDGQCVGKVVQLGDADEAGTQVSWSNQCKWHRPFNAQETIEFVATEQLLCIDLQKV